MSSSVEQPLEVLIAATAAGDRQAFGELYRRTSAKLYGVILRILPDGGRAEDVLQDVYVRVWHAAQGFDLARGRPVTWLAAIARNRALDVVRQGMSAGRRRIVDVDPEDLAGIVDEQPDQSEVLALKQCLEGLNPEHRHCILLAYIDGASREELAEKFERPVGTIKSWLSRGLLALRGCLNRG